VLFRHGGADWRAFDIKLRQCLRPPFVRMENIIYH
jgi:hypothetical protein